MPEIFCDRCEDSTTKGIVVYDYKQDKYLCEKCIAEMILYYQELMKQVIK